MFAAATGESMVTNKEVDIGPAAGRLLRGYRSGSPLFSVKQLVRMRNSAKWNLVFFIKKP
uniref:Uncharacterized protein n=1 Tax=Amphimedon queenslandica TaxID=400682 RepID=A0A1X7SL53_AMPQE